MFIYKLHDTAIAFLIGLAVGVVPTAAILTGVFQHHTNQKLEQTQQEWRHRGVLVEYRGLQECLPAGLACDDSSLVIYADKAQKPANEAPANVANVTAKAPAIAGENCEDEIRQTLRAWSSALNRGDLGTHISFYADQTNPYYSAKGPVTKIALREDKSRLLANGQLATFGIDEIEMPSHPCMTTVTFHKIWETRDGDNLTRHQAWDQVNLERQPQGWRITGEEDSPSKIRVASRPAPRAKQKPVLTAHLAPPFSHLSPVASSQPPRIAQATVNSCTQVVGARE